MRSLLTSSERRRLKAVEILVDKKESMPLSELANELHCSTRVLKDDIAYFKQVSEEFTVESSYLGVQLTFNQNKGMKSLYQGILQESTSFQLLDYVFTFEADTIEELANALFVSASTVYRVINQVNDVIKDYNFHIASNPYRLIGDEKAIRYFFYQFYSERYSRLEWPFELVNEQALDTFLHFFLDFTQLPADFAYFNVFKLVSVVNLIRYKQGHLIGTEDIDINFTDIIPDLSVYTNVFQDFEDKINLKVTNQLINQLFTPYVQNGFSLNYDRLVEMTKSSEKTLAEFNFLSQLLDDLSNKNSIPLFNKKQIVLAIHNSSHLEYQEPRSGYILYNHNKYFADIIKNNFPDIYLQFYEGMKDYRTLMDKPITEDGIHYLIYNLFTYWKNLVPELRKKYEKINILIISEGHISHSRMIKDLIKYEFSEQLAIDIHKDLALSESILENLDYDIIISNFPLPVLESKKTVYIENIPAYNDITKIQTAIDDIITNRINNKTE